MNEKLVLSTVKYPEMRRFFQIAALAISIARIAISFMGLLHPD